MKTKKRKTVSEYFDLKRTQYDLDFFDCYIDYDTPLFIDPWAIRCDDDEFSANCYQKIQSVFEILIDYVKTKQKDKALDLLGNLHEPSETGLGYSEKGKNGSSVGMEKSEKIYTALLNSKAVKTGQLNDLEDTALHIEGIGADNISDIVTNIIRYDLIEYTKEQCGIYNLPLVRTQTKVFWDQSRKDFIQKNYEELLVIDGKKILLVPKKIIRRGLTINYRDFYERGVLEFEQSRHYDARTSLCRTVKEKKTGKRIISGPPYKETLKKDGRYNLSRELVLKYIKDHSEILTTYKDKKSEEDLDPTGNQKILQTQERSVNLKNIVHEKIEKLKEIKIGDGHASEYHTHVFDCLNLIFNDSECANYLSGPKKEDRQNGGRKRIDISFSNSSHKGFFSLLSNYGKLVCAKIFFECKNYTHDLGNPEYDQMIGRFNNRESTVGYIVCRNIKDKEKALNTCKDFLVNGRGYIFILTDEDIIELLGAKHEDNSDTLIDKLLQKKMDELVKILK